jgi:hypothetical protein
MSSFGNSVSGILTLSIENTVIGSVFKAPVNALVSGLVYFAGVTTTAKHAKAMIYNADSGYTLVCQTSSKTLANNTSSWQTFNCVATSTAVLTSGINYLLCGQSYSTTGVGMMFLTSGAVTTRASFASTYVSSTAPVSISGLTTGASGTVSIYAWYTEVSAPYWLTTWRRSPASRGRRNLRLHSGTTQYKTRKYVYY